MKKNDLFYYMLKKINVQKDNIQITFTILQTTIISSHSIKRN
jgi:hypothetical protein